MGSATEGDRSIQDRSLFQIEGVEEPREKATSAGVAEDYPER